MFFHHCIKGFTNPVNVTFNFLDDQVFEFLDATEFTFIGS